MKTRTIKLDQANFQCNEEKGYLKLEGRFISLNPKGFWDLVISNSERIATNADRLRIDLDFEYISSVDLKYMYLMLKSILSTEISHSRLVINWIYEPYDSDHLELGRIIEKSMPDTIKFQFFEKLHKVAA